MWTAIAQFAAALMKLITRRNEDANAPDMKARAQAQDRRDEAGEVNKAIAKRDLKQLNELDSE